MREIFLNVLEASLYGSVVILAVLLLRLLLKKAPKKYTCMLWILVGLRLLLPIHIESNVSLQPNVAIFSQIQAEEEIPQTPQTVTPAVPEDPVAPESPEVPESPVAPNHGADPGEADVQVSYQDNAAVKEHHVQRDYMAVIGGIWLAIAAGFVVFNMVSYLRLKHRVRDAVKIPGGWASDRIETAFILGYAKPQIYIPMSTDPKDRSYIMRHERAHLDKGDHWSKLAGFVVLAIHWFNPLVWVAYILLCRDIEMACDERVIRDMELKDRKMYSFALLACSSNRAHLAACPVAFGEVSVKARIQSVLNYKKPRFWISVVAIAAIGLVLLCFLTNPMTAESDDPVVSGTEPTAEATQEPTVEPTEEPTKEPTEEPTTPKDNDFGMTFEEVNETVYAIRDVNIRKGPGADYDRITMLLRGESITRTGIGDQDWDRVEYNGETAYIHHDYLSTKEPTEEPVANTSDYKSAPSAQDNFIHVYPLGTTVRYDLNGDGVGEDITVEASEHNGKLTVNEVSAEIDTWYPTGYFAIINIDASENTLLVGYCDDGPSADYATKIFAYDGSALLELGVLPGILTFGEGDWSQAAFNGDGTISGRIRMDVLATLYLNTTYAVRNNSVVEIPPDVYDVYGSMGKMTYTTKCELVMYDDTADEPVAVPANSTLQYMVLEPTEPDRYQAHFLTDDGKILKIQVITEGGSICVNSAGAKVAEEDAFNENYYAG